MVHVSHLARGRFDHSPLMVKSSMGIKTKELSDFYMFGLNILNLDKWCRTRGEKIMEIGGWWVSTKN